MQSREIDDATGLTWDETATLVNHESADDFFYRCSKFVFTAIFFVNFIATGVDLLLSVDVSYTSLGIRAAISVASLLALVGVYYRTHARAAVRAAVGLLSLAVVGSLVVSGGLTGPHTIVLSGVLVLSSLLLGSRDSIYTLIFLTCVIAALYFFNDALPQPSFTTEQHQLNLAAQTCISLVILSASAMHFMVRESEIRSDSLLKQAKEFKFRSYHDVLTSLPNRLAANEFIKDIIEKSGYASVFLVDLDAFKLINDTYGHKAGDKVLVKVAALLRQTLSDSQMMIARLGGDEFLIIKSVRSGRIAQQTDMQEYGRNLAKSLDFTVRMGTDLIRVSGSVGGASYPTDSASFSEVMSKADAALYQAKELGKSRFVAYSI